MASPRQGDLFGDDQQNDPFEDEPTLGYRADPDEVRADLLKILAEVRAAQKMPWDTHRLTYYQTVFPQMSNWLPSEEAAQLCFEFAAELTRLKAA